MRSSTARVGGREGADCPTLRESHAVTFAAAATVIIDISQQRFSTHGTGTRETVWRPPPPGALLGPRGNASRRMTGHLTYSRCFISPHFPPAQTRLGTLSVPCSTQWSPLPQPVPLCCQIPSLSPLGVPGVPVTTSRPGPSSRPSADYLRRSFSCTRQRKLDVS